MAGIDDRLIRQNQQLLVNGTQNLLKRTAPEVGPANAAGEKRVSGEQSSRLGAGFGSRFRLRLRGQIKRDASRRVPGCMQDIGLEPAPAEGIALAQ
jgi:hypothetical protein